MDELTDDQLMQMYRDGDAGAFDVLFDRYHASVFHFARAMVGNSGGPEDVLQETFLSVARTAGRYAPRGRFRAWLMRIVRNRCLNRLRGLRARRALLAESRLDLVEPAARAPTPAENVEADERTQAIQDAVAELPDRQREAIALYAFEQMRYREIAEVLELPINTVKTLIHRARANLAEALQPMREDPNRED